MSATNFEIARDIVIALISKQNASLGLGHPETAAQEAAKAFEIVYDVVKRKSGGG
jgi:hypothetical protein